MKPIDRTTLIEFLNNAKTPVTKRELADALGIKGDDRVTLKQLLREMEEEGLLVKQPGQEYAVPQGLPSVGIIEISEIDVDGDLVARPAEWNVEAQGDMPRIEVAPAEGHGHPALEPGDRALAKLIRKSDTLYEAQVIRRLDSPQGHVMGLVKRLKNAYVLAPTNKRARYEFDLAQADLNGAKEGDLAIGEIQPARGLKQKKVRIIEVIGREDDPKAISLIALHESGIRPEFPHEVLASTETMDVADLSGR
jgi:ribonuclease R